MKHNARLKRLVTAFNHGARFRPVVHISRVDGHRASCDVGSVGDASVQIRIDRARYATTQAWLSSESFADFQRRFCAVHGPGRIMACDWGEELSREEYLARAAKQQAELRKGLLEDTVTERGVEQ